MIQYNCHYPNQIIQSIGSPINQELKIIHFIHKKQQNRGRMGILNKNNVRPSQINIRKTKL
jgi:hypothetical protein